MRKTLLVLVLAGLTTAVSAQTSAPQSGQQGQKGPGGEHRGPPPAAIEACKGLAAGAACSFVGRENQNRSGTCYSPSADRPLACRPPHGARNGKGASDGKKG